MLILAAALTLLPAQLGAPAEDALMAPPQLRAPGPNETDVPRNAAFITLEQLTTVELVTFDAATGAEQLTPAEVETMEGITIARLPVQPALSNVTVRLTFPGGFTEDMSWTTGSFLVDPPAPTPQVQRAEVIRPFLQDPHVEIEITPQAELAAAVLLAVDGEQRTRISTAVTFGEGSGLLFGDYGYTGGARDYEVVAVDRAGNVSDAVPVTVGEGGCAATPAGPTGALMVLLLALRRRRRSPGH